MTDKDIEIAKTVAIVLLSAGWIALLLCCRARRYVAAWLLAGADAKEAHRREFAKAREMYQQQFGLAETNQPAIARVHVMGD